MLRRTVITAIVTAVFASAFIAPLAVNAAEGSPSKSTKAPPANLNMKALRRLDFKVTGTSCPACLLKMQRRVDVCPGVFKAAVMLRKPYGGVVIYDSGKTDKDKIFASLKGDEKKVGFEKIEDAAIEKAPIILVPHIMFAKDN